MTNIDLDLTSIGLKIDRFNNVAYLNLGSGAEVFHTVPISDIRGALLNLDYSKNGELLGIEFMDAKQQLPKETFEQG